MSHLDCFLAVQPGDVIVYKSCLYTVLKPALIINGADEEGFSHEVVVEDERKARLVFYPLHVRFIKAIRKKPKN